MDKNTALEIIKVKDQYTYLHPIKWLVFAFISLIIGIVILPYSDNSIIKYLVGSMVLLMLVIYLLHFMYLRSIVYTITEEQIIFKRGIFTINIDYIELYRVLDFNETRPFLMRFIGAMNFSMETSDKSHPTFTLTGIPKSNVDTLIRNLVEKNRKTKRVLVTE